MNKNSVQSAFLYSLKKTEIREDTNHTGAINAVIGGLTSLIELKLILTKYTKNMFVVGVF